MAKAYILNGKHVYIHKHTIPTCSKQKDGYGLRTFSLPLHSQTFGSVTQHKPLPDTHTQYYKCIIMCLGPPFVFTFGETSQDRNKNLTIPMPAYPVPQSTRGCTLGTAALSCLEYQNMHA